MAIGGTNRWNAHELPAYDRLAFYRNSRAEGRAQQAKLANLASAFTSVGASASVEMGNIVSRVAMKRMADATKAASAEAQAKLAKYA